MDSLIAKFLADTASKKKARQLENAREVEKIRAIRAGGAQLFDDLGSDLLELVEDFESRSSESHGSVNVSRRYGRIVIEAFITPHCVFTIEINRGESYFDVSFKEPSYRDLGWFGFGCADVPRRIEIESTEKGGVLLVVQPSDRGQEPVRGTKGVSLAVLEPLLCRILEAGSRTPKQPSA